MRRERNSGKVQRFMSLSRFCSAALDGTGGLGSCESVSFVYIDTNWIAFDKAEQRSTLNCERTKASSLDRNSQPN